MPLNIYQTFGEKLTGAAVIYAFNNYLLSFRFLEIGGSAAI